MEIVPKNEFFTRIRRKAGSSKIVTLLAHLMI